MKEVNFRITVKDDKQLLKLLAELMTKIDELLLFVPDWNSIEAKNKADEIRGLLAKLLEVRK